MKPTQTILQLLVGLFLSLILMLFDSMGKLGGVRLVVEGIVKPGVVVLGKVSDVVRFGGGYITFVRVGSQRLGDLEKQVVDLQRRLTAAEISNIESDGLKQVLSSASAENYTPAIVYITGKSMFIENHDFSPGQLVVSPEKAVVGVIDSSGKWLSRVKLLTDVDSKLAALVLLPDGRKADGEIRGEFGGKINIHRVLSAVDLVKGEAIVTQGDSGRTPPGILIGWIGEQQSKDESSVYQEAPITWAVNPDKLNVVLVIK